MWQKDLQKSSRPDQVGIVGRAKKFGFYFVCKINLTLEAVK